MPLDREHTSIIAGREAVDTYRLRHEQLYTNGWYPGISTDHIPLLNTLLTRLEAVGFNSLDEFFTASMELNGQELGSTSEESWR